MRGSGATARSCNNGALIDETLKRNGLSNASDIQGIPPAKLQEIFGADAALYVTVKQYGASYRIIKSVVTVTADAKLLDLKSGVLLWDGSASASSEEGGNTSVGGLVGILVSAAINQVINNVTEASHKMAGITSERLLAAGSKNGILYGPYSPRYGAD
ncbi:DUF799 family lipoprotein [Herbaspirillum sp. RTI4]|uniref:GNA1162 family protein n=1 Tax=Herbaspirillum sp. RTI4 TaxID=3048640 RepID=UPI002AB47667|nr:GNA1162 family protein [Herbaspirillum sp. RTI4]MDY7578207.1 DUF799 family lipoprotein [Herbaspirillum sp. RTI4]MEA9981545.1 DUF799 family lipoprotein [Herbaspirillum sp. RTI4]